MSLLRTFVQPPRHHPRASSRRTLLTTFSLCAILYAAYYALDSAVGNLAPSKEPLRSPHVRMPTGSPESEELYGYDATPPRTAAKKRVPKPPRGKGPASAHEFRRNGLLIVSPEGRHPIYDLIERAEDEWQRKLDRQSKSLDEAVAEYKRRYNRPPPKGFDRWWDYVEENNVLLPDEYDQIHRDLEHFWALHPEDMRKLELAYEDHRDSYTLGKSGHHPISIVNASLNENAMQGYLQFASEMIDTLQPVQDWIPDFRAVFSPHDTPDLPVSYQHMKLAKKTILHGKYLDLNNIPQYESRGWLSGCSPKSPARTQPFDLENPPAAPTNKSFIFDHYAAMDPCQHPSLLHQHGQFVAHHYGPAPQVPLVPRFSYSTTLLHYDIRPATPFNWVEDITDLEWEKKTDDRLLWRGANTGIWHGAGMRWRASHRIRMVQHAKRRQGSVDVLVDAGPKAPAKRREVGLKRINPVMLDIEFAGKPLSCEEEICDELLAMFDWEENMDWHTAGDYKYVMDMDGNGWSSRFKRLMTTKSLIFKASVYPEWFTERLMPWVHYVPVQVDFSDLYDALAFFRGGVNGEGGHDDLAKKIAYAGRDWSKRFWRKEDLTAYNFRLMLEYARLMSQDRGAMAYEEPDDEF